MKTLVTKINNFVTWKKMMVALLVAGSLIMGWQVYIYQTRTWFDKVVSFFG
jgi:hypothetical protein